MAEPLKILVMGSNGRLGKALLRRYAAAGLEVKGVGRAELDLERPELINETLAQHDFNVLINAAGNTNVDDCERHPEQAHLVNAISPTIAASHCVQRGARFVQVSTDYVFAGDEPTLRKENDPAHPISHYGRSKLAGEEAVAAVLPEALVTRVSWVFGIEKPSFPDWIISQAKTKPEVAAVNDKWACPAFADDITEWILALLQCNAEGVFHLCNQGSCTWQEYAQAALDIAASLGIPLQTHSVQGHSMQGFAPFIAARPPFTSMDTGRFTQITGVTPRPWQAALEEYLGKVCS